MAEDINQLLKVRREKLANLIEAGKNPFEITKCDVTHHSMDIKDNYDEMEGKTVTIAGRMMFKRVMGKASFCNVQDLKGSIQAYVARDEIGEDSYKDFKKYDIGDILGIKGKVFKTKTGEICGAEALVRYYDQEKGTIPPSRFLPYIEKAGLIRYIDLFVLRDVCRLLRQWMACGREPLPISLNFSRATILEPGILEETNRIVESFGIPKQLLEIEVTETIGSIDNASLKAIVNQFVQAGYQIALDDFGAEYSNIYVLYSLNISTLKLDRRIISDIYHDNRARLVVKQIIELCRQLGITSVAEGVEIEQHLEILREMDCDVIQGYYLNKPLPENEFYTQYLNGSK